VISESQAEFLLSQCETWLCTKLNKLRWRLRSEHEQTESHLWELIVLHATASAVISRHHKQDGSTLETSSLIEHEGEQEAVPDIKLKSDGYDPFWIEVAYITPRNQQQETDLVRFPSWVRKELSKTKVADARPLRIRLEPADTSKDVQVPPNNSWRQLLKTDKWKTFVAGLLSGKMQSILCLEESEKANVIVRIEGVEQGDFVSSSFPTPNVPKCAEDHPIYQTIKKKAQQARDWAASGKNYKPLVLFIGASESIHQINDGGTPSSISPKQAVYSALADTEQWDLTTTLNAIGTAPWPGTKARRQRVPGSRLISAVVIVTIKNQDSGYGLVKRASRLLVIKNPHPDVELTVEQEQFLNLIDFNQVEYQSGREIWEPPHSKDNPEALKRYRLYELRKGCRLENGHDFTRIEIPSRIVAHFLAGNITADEVWDDNRLDADNYPDSTPSYIQDIGCFLREDANIRQQIVKVKFVQVDPKSRDESRIRLEFDAITAPTEPIDENCPKGSIESDAKGTFTLKLATSLMTCLLAGKITAGEAWKSENNQKIGDFLKDAVSRGQKIIDARFVQVGSEADSEPSLILKFGAASDTTIREDKKRIQEEKQRRRQLKKLDKKE
jgi:hypothetical protein